MEGATVPIFECPTCGKRDLVPLASCEWMLDTLPAPRFDADNTPLYSLKCPDCRPLKVEVIEGDLLDQDVEVIVNAWNRNIIPWWLLLPQGVSGAIKRRGGTQPFKELAKQGPMPLGCARLTSAGSLPFKGIIHVAGINMLWRASERSIRDSARNAVSLAHQEGFTSMAFPLIGAGSGGFNEERSKAVMLDELSKLILPVAVKVVVFQQGMHEPR
jgi:O-acetyl-ADP-ribose deacetylase (regulator of RNase III)